jgi:hypothetical protein
MLNMCVLTFQIVLVVAREASTFKKMQVLFFKSQHSQCILRRAIGQGGAQGFHHFQQSFIPGQGADLLFLGADFLLITPLRSGCLLGGGFLRLPTVPVQRLSHFAILPRSIASPPCALQRARAAVRTVCVNLKYQANF